ncbi:ABC transporter ATP-binding protein [Paracidovorax wautersii]|uniref:Nucleoside ABC transporter ATP-binding protein n=1 Tax=Paracidovorax wautersii TaxID=1177982 RepID=A0A1I2C1U8_9BURK|nr:ABC transporter ATP-binding protein [Paracidovorax wautersii]SFE62215.1 nucleoside ABC transporter ATP-binding protein [Paracidovorax wautersii]
MSSALALRGIRKSFDGFLALDDAQFDARWGEVHALLGENGAGKSSLMNIAAGLYAPERGEMLVDDNAVRLAGPRDAAQHHIGMVHQHFKLVRPFTVAQNILLGLPADQAGHRRQLAALEERIRAQAGELGFAIDPRQRVDSLSIAEQQRVEILKVLLAGARILILDEPTAVLTDQEAERLLRTVQGLAQRGCAVVLVTHKMADVKAYADRVTVMRGGRTVATLDPRTTPAAELVRLTVGETAPPVPRVRSAPGPACLSLQGLSTPAQGGRQALAGVTLDVHAGEIYGIAGVGGNGQGELAAAIMGLIPEAGGDIVLEGFGSLRAAPATARRALGLAVIPADRYGHALAGGLSIAENFAIGQVHGGRYGSPWWLRQRRIDQEARDAVAAFDVQGVRSLRQKAALLSGGNAQKLVIAREFSKQPRLILAHSPSRGLDVRATAQVHARLLAARDAGAAVLLISEDLDEVLALADRIGVMAGGRIVAEFDQPADRQAIGQAMVHHD